MNIGIYHNIAFGGAFYLLENHIKLLSKNHNIFLYSIDVNEDICDLYNFKYNSKLMPVLSDYVVKEKKFQDPRTYNTYYKLIKKFGRGQHRFKSYIKRKDINLISRTAEKIAEEFEKDKCDVVIGHIDKFTQIPVPLAKTKIPTIYFCVEPNRSLYDGGNYSKAIAGFKDSFLRKLLKLDRSVAKTIDQFACNSYYTKETIYKVYGKLAWVISSAVDVQVFKPIPSIKKENMVLSVGVLMAHKAPMFLLESMAFIKKNNRPKVIFVYPRGGGNLQKDLYNFAMKNQIEIEFYFGVETNKLVELYNRATVCAYPAIMEPGGLVPLESQACGTPVVAINEGGNREEIRNGLTGILVDRDEREFGAAIESFFIDDGKIARFGENGTEWIHKEWRWEKSLEKFDNLLSGSIDGE